MKENVNFFIFSVALIEIWLQHPIKRIILGIIPTFYVWIRPIWENKNITSSDCHHCFLTFFRFFGHFRLPEVIETSTKPQFQPLFMPSKKVWANILSGAAVMERPDLSPPKKKVVSCEFKKFSTEKCKQKSRLCERGQCLLFNLEFKHSGSVSIVNLD